MMRSNSVLSAAILNISFYPIFSLAANVPPEKITGVGSSQIHSNMVVRVLLERETTSGTVSSSLRSTYVKIDEGRSWQKFPKDIKLSVRNIKKKAQMALNGVVIKAKDLLLRGGPHYTDRVRYAGLPYRGALKVTALPSTFTVTNVLPLDEYLSGTLAAEMHGSWEVEALKAQAIASRTYALYMMRHPKHSLYDLDGTTQDQVYGGSDRESAKVAKVIADTSGFYLSYLGEPIKAYFHARCGGMTETASDVWHFKGHPFKTRVRCPYCQKQPYKWLASISTKELFDSLRLPVVNAMDLSHLTAEKTESGRVSALKFNLNGKEKKVTSDELRGLLGYSRIKSANFDWKVNKDRIQFEGKGSGHGVGMCQWGAQHLAKQGKTFKEILAYYYPDVKLEKLNPLKVESSFKK